MHTDSHTQSQTGRNQSGSHTHTTHTATRPHGHTARQHTQLTRHTLSAGHARHALTDSHHTVVNSHPRAQSTHSPHLLRTTHTDKYRYSLTAQYISNRCITGPTSPVSYFDPGPQGLRRGPRRGRAAQGVCLQALSGDKGTHHVLPPAIFRHIPHSGTRARPQQVHRRQPQSKPGARQAPLRRLGFAGQATDPSEQQPKGD